MNFVLFKSDRKIIVGSEFTRNNSRITVVYENGRREVYSDVGKVVRGLCIEVLEVHLSVWDEFKNSRAWLYIKPTLHCCVKCLLTGGESINGINFYYLNNTIKL